MLLAIQQARFELPAPAHFLAQALVDAQHHRDHQQG
jgi:hypothetical protein